MLSYDEIARHLADASRTNEAISQWSVGMHIQHCALAMIRISEALTASTPPMPRRSFRLLRTLILLRGKIPRGRGRAPKISLPDEHISIDQLSVLLAESWSALERTVECGESKWFQHPIFGALTKKETVRFIAIHNKHHAHIIRDIIAGGRS